MSSNSLHNSGPQSVATLPSNRGSADSALSSNPQPTQEGTLSASVSSLRALALSTLRTKRRREGTPSQQVPAKLTNPRDSAVPNSVFLDYGSETNDLPDSSQSPPSSSKDSPKDTQDNNQPSKSQAAEELREEGEISDEEAPSVAPTPPSSRETQKLRSHPQELPTSVISTPVMSSRKIYPQKSPQVVHGEYTTRNIVPSATAQPHNPWNDWIPSQNHVRPGLKMNMEQLNYTKELVLELLGWGVSPEYLVDCGLTREAVFYTFTELNLRLPKNLDLAGLVPIVVPTNTSLPVASAGEPLVSPVSGPQSKGDYSKAVFNHPLPPKPSTVSGPSQPPPESLSETPPVSTLNLSDMEAQRKLELQARKAVLASRKKKSTSSTPSKVEPPTTSTDMATAVDDFLNSMLESTLSPTNSVNLPLKPKALSGGVALGVSISTSSNELNLSTSSTQDAMDVDLELIPGLGSSSIATNEGENQKTLIPEPMQDIKEYSTPNDTPSSESSSRSSMSREMSESTTTQPTLSAQPPNTNIPFGIHKRGTKRPVAMDFVDMDQNMSSSSRLSSFPVHPPFVRRKMASFAGLGRHIPRKCVIDVSDSEDESDDESDIAMEDSENLKSTHSSSEHSPAIPVSRPVSTRTYDSSPAPISRPASATTPELLQYEAERLKELIKKRELGRKKLNEKSRLATSTPTPPSGSLLVPLSESSTMSGLSVRTKQGDLDNSLQTSNRTDSTPTSDSCDQADEDAVMQALSGPLADSSAATPIDIKNHSLENRNTGEVVLTMEASEEKMNSDNIGNDQQSLPMKTTSDVSLAQVTPQEDSSVLFSPYHSPFSSYPLLQSRSRISANISFETHLPYSVSSFSSTSTLVPDVPSSTTRKLTIPDLRPLRDAVVSREISSDRQICQFEIPGGGVCHNKICTDMHLRDLEPNDSDTARFLLETMSSTLKPFSVSEIERLLSKTRQRLNGVSKTTSTSVIVQLEDIVMETVSALVGS